MKLKKYLHQYLSFRNISKKKEEEIFADIIARYSEGHRSYHTLSHISSFLNICIRYKAGIEDFESLFYACCFHDIIYDTRKQDNEEKSSEYAALILNSIGIDAATVKRTSRLIESTKHHVPADTAFDAYIFLDADLAILGAGWRRHRSYAASIRKEYSWVPDKAYRAGRGEVLKKFLLRERIYYTDEFYRTFETKARDNIKRELAAIDSSLPPAKTGRTE